MWLNRRLPTLLVLLLTTAVRADVAADLDGYRRDVAPLFERLCVGCHSGDEPEGNFTLGDVDPNILTGDDLETWRLIDEQLRFGDMPPAGEEQPTPAERGRILDWIRGELLKTQEPGAASHEKLLLPEFGNHVDHLALFDVRRTHVTPAAPRIWRLRPDIYDAVAPRLGEGIAGLANALSVADGSEFKDFSAPYFLDEASTQQLYANAKKIAAAQVGPRTRDGAFKALVGDEPPDERAVNSAIETAFRKALGRGPTDEERRRFAAFHGRSVEIGGHESAGRALLAAVLMQPEFVFRRELGDGEPDEHGRVRLTQVELAHALSYALDNRPLDEFTKLAGADELATAEQVAGAVRGRLEDDSPLQDRNPRVVQFFREYFHYPFAGEVFKDKPDGGTHEPNMLISDLEMTLGDVLAEDRDVLARLLTTRRFYVGTKWGSKEKSDLLEPLQNKDGTYQTAFGLPLDWKWAADRQPVTFREDERAGLLTHPAWLAAWSGNFDNHPVQRGKWIRTHLLGGSVPDVPIGVDARVPEMEHTTFRDRLKLATSAAECWRCHRKMDPLGLPFERYDHYGRVQRLDAGQPVVTTGAISRTPFPELHRDVSGPTEIMEVLARSERVEQVFVRHAFRYFLGRNETLGDANTLQDAHRAYRESNGSVRALVVSLLSSESFLLRQKRLPTNHTNQRE